MAKGVNKVLLLGNVGKDPEMKSTTGGTLVATFGLATADRKKDPQGNWQDTTEWHNVVVYGRTAEIVRDYVKKGKELFIEGKIETRSWDDKQSGQKKFRTEIIVSELTLLGGSGGRQGGEQGSSSSGGNSRPNASSTASYDQRAPVSQPDYGDTGITDDDIPF